MDPRLTAEARKALPLATGCLDYFPDALLAVAELSRIGNEQHNPGTPLHWDRSKSGDEADALMRHFVDRGTVDTDGVRHSAKVAWRALALLQKELEEARTEPLTPAPYPTATPRPAWWTPELVAEFPTLRYATSDEVLASDYDPVSGRDKDGDYWVMVDSVVRYSPRCLRADRSTAGVQAALRRWFK